MKLTVRPGVIQVNDVDQVVDLPDVAVWEIDLRSKYPAGYQWRQGSTLGVSLFADDRTLHAVEDQTMHTGLFIDVPDEDHANWAMMADWARYTVRVCVYRRPPLEEPSDAEA